TYFTRLQKIKCLLNYLKYVICLLLDILKINKNDIKMYDTIKTHNQKIYTGMRIGGAHSWNYNNGKWLETKKTPDKWSFTFDSIKTRENFAPKNTGAHINTKFHWYIIAEQMATKLNDNSYMTSMRGIKFKLGHKRPYWRTFSYNYSNQIACKDRIIKILEDTLKKLRTE
ncbi:MAG: hypothetical protein Lokiarch_13210, partial [Candidatus Lokiarchaeum sp. GC14_75]